MSLLSLVYDYFAPHLPQSPAAPPSSLPPLVSPSFSQRLHAACQPRSESDLMRDHTKHDLARAQVDSVRLEERVKMLERTLKETRDILRAREGEVEKMRKELKEKDTLRRRSDASRYPGGSLDTRMAASDLAQRLRRRDSPSPSTTSTDKDLKSISPIPVIHHHPLDIDEERARARIQETYMSRLDSWSGAQVLQAIHDLNSEILQFAASAIEFCSFLPNQTPKSQSLNDTSSRLGPTMTRLLHTRNHSSDPLLIQLALQSSLTLCTARALSSFIIGLPSKSDLLLSQIYSEMQKGEEQPVFKKWRALTERYVGVFYPTLGEYSVGEVADTMIRWCADVLVVSGCSFIVRPPNGNNTPSTTTPNSTSSSQQPSPSSSPPTTFSTPKPLHHSHNHHHHHHVSPQTYLRTHHHDQLKRIAQRILRIASITREEILSTSFEVVIADYTSQSQSQQENFNNDFGSEMVDAFGEYTSESQGKVLGTVELGLRCVTKVNERDVVVGAGNHNHNNNGANGLSSAGTVKDVGEPKLETRLLLRPKVVLESVLEVLDR